MSTNKPCRSRELKRTIAAEIESVRKKAELILTLRHLRGESDDLIVTVKTEHGSVELNFRVNTMNLPSAAPVEEPVGGLFTEENP